MLREGEEGYNSPSPVSEGLQEGTCEEFCTEDTEHLDPLGQEHMEMQI